MRTHKKLVSLLLILLAVLVVTAVAALQSQDKSSQAQNQPQKRKPKFEDERWPLVDYDAPELTAPEERAKRHNKNSRYDKQDLVSKPSPNDFPDNFEANLINDWAVSFPALPVERSNVIILGKVTSAKAYLSNDKTGVYSEFTVHVCKVLKDDSATPVAVDNDLIAERIGGRVRMPSGYIQQYGIANQGMPTLGGRYVFFLKRNEQGQDYSILTGYELKDGRVQPLDGVDAPTQSGKRPQFAAYEGMAETVFLTTVQQEIAKLTPPIP